jgi:hypothetical protein
MNIAKISTNQSESYIPREIKVDSTKQTMLKTEQSNGLKMNKWQQDILINAMDKLINNIQLDNSHPLGKAENQPLENYKEAMDVLSEMNSESLRNFGSKAQANISAETFLQLVVEG